MTHTSNEVVLQEQFQTKPWFNSVGRDQYGRLTVYVNFMNGETFHEIPNKLGNEQVLVHFTSSKTAKLENFITTAKLFSFPEITHEFIEDNEETINSDDNHLSEELIRLQLLCNVSILENIFYEIHDGKNAITNLSKDYALVREGLEKLYDEYGFDVLYETIMV